MAGAFFVGDVDGGLRRREEGSVLEVGEEEEGSSAWLEWVTARQGGSLVRWTMVFVFAGMRGETMVNSCQGLEGSKIIEVSGPRDGAADGGATP